MRPRPLLLGLFAIILVLTAYPFYPLRPIEGMYQSLLGFFDYAIEPPVAQTVLERVLTLLPAGYLIGRLIGHRSLAQISIIAAIAFPAIAVGLEFVQLPIAPRHPRFSDALVALWCLFTGLTLATFLHDRRPKARPLILALGVGMVVATSGLLVLAGPSTVNWSCGFQLVAGDEVGLVRRLWSGRIAGAAIYPRPLDGAAAGRLSQLPFTAADDAMRKSEGAVWSYAGEDAGRVPLSFGAAQGGASGVSLMPEAQRIALCHDVRRSGAFAVELRVQPDRAEQSGPARILSFSGSIGVRNFTVGQQGSSYDFRMRTLSSGANGLSFVVRTPPGSVAPGRWQHLLMVYEQGRASIYIDGRRQAGPVDFAGPVGRGRSATAPMLIAILSIASGALALLYLAWTRRLRLRAS